MRNYNLPVLGAGAGLRHAHFAEILKSKPKFNWFEIIAEDFIGIGGWSADMLQEISKHYKIVPHGVGLSVGSTDPLDRRFLKDLRRFLDDMKAPWYSDHLCFTMVDHTNLEDLIPLPFTTEAVDNAVSRIKSIQDAVGRPFLVENVTRYITVSDREMGESEFVNRVLEGADCGLLLDLTNVTLNSKFHGYDAWGFVQSLPLHRVGQVHLAGWEGQGDDVIDSHDAPVPPEVWELFRNTIALTGPTSALVEWDKSLPSVERLLKEAQMADRLMQESVRRAA